MAMDDKTVKIVLDERDLPTHWYNIVPDLPSPPAPPLHPDAGQWGSALSLACSMFDLDCIVYMVKATEAVGNKPR